MNIVRGFAAGAAAAAAAEATRVPHDPQNANPGAIGLPQVAQMTSADGAGALSRATTSRGSHCRWPAFRRRWRRCRARPPATLRPPRERRERRRRAGGDAAGGDCTIGIGVNCAGIFGESFQGMPPPLPFWAATGEVPDDCVRSAGAEGSEVLISPAAIPIGGGVASPPRPPAGTNSVRAIASGGGVRSVAIGSAGAGRAALGGGVAGIGALGAAAGGAAGTAFASSFPHPRQNL